MTIYDYIVSADGSYQTNVLSAGQPDGTGASIVDGTKTTTVVGSVGQLISRTTVDIASSITNASEIYSNYDEFQRPRHVVYLDGTSEDVNYACCGLDNTTDRDGVTTQYWYDDLKRLVATTRLNVTTTNILDAAGNVLATKRIGSDNSQITLRQAAYDVAGRLVLETNALNGVTSYTNIFDGSGQTVKTNTYPEGGTRIETYYQDGALSEVGGTAAQPMRYLYGVETDTQSPDYRRPSTYEIRLTAAASPTGTNEWTRTFTDMLGRTYKTVYSKVSAPYPYSQSFYNTLGQVWKQTDPEGVITLYQYNAKGELEYTALDTNRNNTIDFSGTDRITRTVNDVLYNSTYGVNVRRSQTYAYVTDNASTSLLIAKQETSTDGLRSWQTQYRSPVAPVVTQTQTQYNMNDGVSAAGYRTVTVTQPDTSKIVTVYY